MAAVKLNVKTTNVKTYCELCEVFSSTESVIFRGNEEYQGECFCKECKCKNHSDAFKCLSCRDKSTGKCLLEKHPRTNGFSKVSCFEYEEIVRKVNEKETNDENNVEQRTNMERERRLRNITMLNFNTEYQNLYDEKEEL